MILSSLPGFRLILCMTFFWIHIYERSSTKAPDILFESHIIDENEIRLFCLEINAQLYYTFCSLRSTVAGSFNPLGDRYSNDEDETMLYLKRDCANSNKVWIEIRIYTQQNWSCQQI